MRGDRPGNSTSRVVPKAFTPHARGSTSVRYRRHCRIFVYPACAGIDPKILAEKGLLFCLPRMRGDRPSALEIVWSPSSFTPHARGSTLRRNYAQQLRDVYPACAGIDHRMQNEMPELAGLPRMRGDRPHFTTSRYSTVGFTPHARGSTHGRILRSSCGRVYPACAGIDRHYRHVIWCKQGLPRMRGDRPSWKPPYWGEEGFTPHARGSTFDISNDYDCSIVYPACAGIDLHEVFDVFPVFRLPRMRGDRPSLLHHLLQFG